MLNFVWPTGWSLKIRLSQQSCNLLAAKWWIKCKLVFAVNYAGSMILQLCQTMHFQSTVLVHASLEEKSQVSLFLFGAFCSFPAPSSWMAWLALRSGFLCGWWGLWVFWLVEVFGFCASGARGVKSSVKRNFFSLWMIILKWIEPSG